MPEVDNPDGPTIPNTGFEDQSYAGGNTWNGGFNPMYGGGYNQEPVVEERISVKEEAERWRNRRRLAYISLCGIFVSTILLDFVVPLERLPALSNISEWVVIILGGIIGSYVGSATWHDVMSLKTRVVR